ncbi:MAG: hypothetical protein JXB07_00050 [Anaerolineae bacterium]|nr:hypothetical protein [Anaerolineae bacterium]
MSVQWITYKGKKILYGDYKGLKDADLLNALKTENEILQQSPDKVLILEDFTGALSDIAVINYLKSVGKAAEMKTEKAALVGILGLKRLMLVTYNRISGADEHQRLFATIDEAKEWLVGEQPSARDNPAVTVD